MGSSGQRWRKEAVFKCPLLAASLVTARQSSPNKKKQDEADICIGQFVAFHIEWEGKEEKRNKKQRFYVGKVVAVNAPDIKVHYFHASREFSTYKAYQKSDKEMVTHVKFVIMCRADLMNESGGIQQKYAKTIMAQLKEDDTDADEEEIKGYDEHIENPTELIRQLCEKDRRLCDKDAQIAELNSLISKLQLENSAKAKSTSKPKASTKTSKKQKTTTKKEATQRI